MKAFNESTQKMQDIRLLSRGVSCITDSVVEFGYFTKTAESIVILYKSSYDAPEEYIKVRLFNIEANREKLVFSNWLGEFIIRNQHNTRELAKHEHLKAQGVFPYHFDRRYEAVDNLELFKNKQSVVNPVELPEAKYLKYTFGIEYETSMGIIPEDICFRDGLIPLRDGSISGLEYSTVVLGGNKGLNLLKQQIDTLRRFTEFNKECSLHMHFGGFPVDAHAIFVLYWVIFLLHSDIKRYVPAYTFNSEKYKKTGKNYCKALTHKHETFAELYEYFVGQKFLGDLSQPHPADTSHERKWQINGRYYMCNFINMLCYKSPKTVEFRFLRPTYNYRKIYTWLFAFNAILQFAENLAKETVGCTDEDTLTAVIKSTPSIESILRSVYPEDFAEELITTFSMIEVAVQTQTNNGDLWGHDISIENKIIPDYK